MLILTVRTDNPQAEIGLYEDRQQLASEVWQAHRELGRTIHDKIAAVLATAGKDWHDIEGIVAFRGPGSFTGLRIGLTVANTLGYSQVCPVVGAVGESWTSDGIGNLLAGVNELPVMPEYGSEANITAPKK